MTGIVGLVHAPFHSAAYLATKEGASGDALLPWAEPVRDAGPWALEFNDAWSVYRGIGSIQPFLLAGMVAGLWILHRLNPEGSNRFRQLSFWPLFSVWCVFTGATAFEYATPFRDEAFLAAFPALLLSMVGFIVYGIASLRAKILPRHVCWLLIGGAISFIPMAALFGHIAMALVGLNIALIRIGALGLRFSSTAQATASPVGGTSQPSCRSHRRVRLLPAEHGTGRVQGQPETKRSA